MKDNNQSRRSMLKNLFGGLITAGAAMAGVSAAQAEPSSMLKANKGVTYIPGEERVINGQTISFFDAAATDNLIFLSGIGYHKEGDITKHTTEVLKTMKQWLDKKGSSMDLVVKCNVYLADLADYEAMNKVYYGKFFVDHHPARTTVACYGGIPGNSLVEIDCVAKKK